MKITDVTTENLTAGFRHAITRNPEKAGDAAGVFTRDVLRGHPLTSKLLRAYSVLDHENAPLLALAAGIQIGLTLAEIATPTSPVVEEQAVS